MFLCWVSRVLRTGDRGDVRNEGLPGLRSNLEDAPVSEAPVWSSLALRCPESLFLSKECLLSVFRAVLLNEQDAIGMGNHAVPFFCFVVIN